MGGANGLLRDPAAFPSPPASYHVRTLQEGGLDTPFHAGTLILNF